MGFNFRVSLLVYLLILKLIPSCCFSIYPVVISPSKTMFWDAIEWKNSSTKSYSYPYSLVKGLMAKNDLGRFFSWWISCPARGGLSAEKNVLQRDPTVGWNVAFTKLVSMKSINEINIYLTI